MGFPRGPLRVASAALAWCMLGGLAQAKDSSTMKPNIVIYMVDDMGWADPGFRNNNQIKTPHMNAIWERGLELTRYYVHSVCSPSRAALMTGRYSHHTGVHDWLRPADNIAVMLDEVFLSDRMKEANYATYMVGKWHLGHHMFDYLPSYRGFDYYYGLLTGAGDYFMGFSNFQRYWFQLMEATTPKCRKDTCIRIASEAQLQYSTELFTRKAIAAVNRHADSKTDMPLFMFVSFQGVHYGGLQPDQVPQFYVAPYLETLPSGKRRQFAGMLSAVDSGIGNITEVLNARGFTDENTLIILTTDNGGPVETGDACGSRNTPFRGGKHALFEGGVRGTALLAGYGIQRKGTYDGLMHIVDWYATLADVAGYSLKGGRPLDGVSHWPRLTAAEGDATLSPAPRTSVVLGNVSHFGRGFGMVIDDDEGKQWKIVAGSPGFPDTWSSIDDYGAHEDDTLALDPAATPCHKGFCLFELTSDPEERQDLATNPKYANTLDKLKKRILAELATYRDIPRNCKVGAKPKYDEIVGNTWWPWCEREGAMVS